MNNPDPREQLVMKGNALLDLTYRSHIWEQQYPEMAALLNDRVPSDDPRVAALVNTPVFITALFTKLSLENDFERARTEYLMLRQTIEALDNARNDIDIID
jgi:hypothetical protein